MKLKKTSKYIIFGIAPDNKEIIVLKTSKETDYEKFIEDLPEAEPRWAVYDFEYEKEEGGKRNKLVFYSWYVFPLTFYSSVAIQGD